jgi:hypothetical protein
MSTTTDADSSADPAATAAAMEENLLKCQQVLATLVEHNQTDAVQVIQAGASCV